jgi:hypothetical protein
MGLLKDAVNLGYLTLDDYNDLAEEWSDLGYDARHSGDVEALQKMMMDFLDYGILDLASAVADQYFAAIDFYEDAYGYTIYYNSADTRWHDTVTHQYVKDPYEWIRD